MLVNPLGSVTLERLLHPLNVPLSISVTPEGITIEDKAVQSANEPPPRLVRLSGRMMLAKLSQLTNDPLMDLRPLPKSTYCSFVQREKAPELILVKLSGIITLVISLWANADLPMAVT